MARLYRGRIIWLLAQPIPPSPVSKLDRRHTCGRLRKRDNLLTREGGREWAKSQIIRPQESLILYMYKSFNTLCIRLFRSYVYTVNRFTILSVQTTKNVTLYQIN